MAGQATPPIDEASPRGLGISEAHAIAASYEEAAEAAGYGAFSLM